MEKKFGKAYHLVSMIRSEKKEVRSFMN